MQNLIFRPYTTNDYAEIVPMIMELYNKDGATTVGAMTIEKIDLTLATLTTQNNLGDVFIFELGNIVVGYAIITSFWSNEFGGRVLIIDELLVKPDLRNQGISTKFFNYLFEKRIYNETVYMLEVGVTNKKAAAFYKRLGFKNFKTKHQFRLA